MSATPKPAMNLMNSDCETVLSFYTYTPLHIAQWLQIVFSLPAMLLASYTIFKILHKSIFDRILKEQLLVLYCLIFSHSILDLTLQVILITVRYVARAPCDATINTMFCYSFRITMTVAFYGFVCIHISITIERLVSTLSRSARLNMTISRTLMLCAILLAMGLVAFQYGSDDYAGRTPYCSGATPNSTNIAIFNMWVLFALDVLTVSIDFTVLRYHQIKLKRRSNYSLLETYRHRQMIMEIEHFLPCALFHTLFNLGQVGAFLYTYYQKPFMDFMPYIALNAYAYMMPYYCLGAPILLLYLLHKKRIVRQLEFRNAVAPIDVNSHRKIYFGSLDAQWEEHYTKNNPPTKDETKGTEKNYIPESPKPR